MNPTFNLQQLPCSEPSGLLAVALLQLHDLLLELWKAAPEVLVAGFELVALDAALELLFPNTGADVAVREHDAAQPPDRALRLERTRARPACAPSTRHRLIGRFESLPEPERVE